MTIGQFLNTLPDYSYVEGESLITDLLMTLAQQLTFQDMVSIVASNPTPASLAGLQAPLRQFINSRVLRGAEPTRENVETALLNLADDWAVQMVNHKKFILEILFIIYYILGTFCNIGVCR